MPAYSFDSPGLFALQRLWARWVVGYEPMADTRPIPADPARLGVPAGVVLPEPVTRGRALDFYRRRRWWRTTSGAEMFRFKYRGDTDSGWRLVFAAAAFLKVRGVADAVDSVIPAPSNPVFREFDRPRWLAERLAQSLGKPLITEIFSSTRLNVPQKGITSDKLKKKNVAGLYIIPPDRTANITGRRILLIDDVCDSGHTLRELRAVLLEAGAREVTPFAMARVRLTGEQW